MSTGFLPINLANVQAATGFDYKPGTYMLQVESTEVKANTDGQGQRLVVNNVIVMGPGPSTEYQGRKIFNSYQVTEKGAPFLKRMFLCCGITEEYIMQNGGQVSPDWLVGRQYVAQVVKNGQYTNITNERPISEWEAALKSSPPPQQAGLPGGPQQAFVPPPSVLQPSAPPMQTFAPPTAAPQAFSPPMMQAAPQAQMQAPQMQMQAPQVQAQQFAPQMAPVQGAQLPTPSLPPMGSMPQMGVIQPPIPPAGTVQ